MSNHWRANIKDVNNLYDIDQTDLLIHLRHVYLEIAKDPETFPRNVHIAMIIDEILERWGL